MNELLMALIRASQHRIIGRLGGDPEVKYLQSGNCVCNARIAVNRPGAKRDDGIPPDWFKLEIWGEQAQGFADAHAKGQLCDVTGRVMSERWTDRNTGEERTGLILTVDSWQPMGQSVAATTPAAKPAPAAKPVTWESVTGIDSDDVPF